LTVATTDAGSHGQYRSVRGLFQRHERPSIKKRIDRGYHRRG